MRELPSGLPSRARTPVRCERCQITVLAGKASWQQTSVQWPKDVSTCPELRAARADTARDARVRGCLALRRSIEKAAMTGTLEIPD